MGKPEPKISERFATATMMRLINGDLLLSREDFRLTNNFVPGFWGHVGVYFDGAVIEATDAGVVRTPIAKWLYQKDHVAHLRPFRLYPEWKLQMCEWIYGHIGKLYDYGFEANDELFYCSELVVDGYNSVAELKIEYKMVMGEETITPQDIYNESNHFVLVGEEVNV